MQNPQWIDTFGFYHQTLITVALVALAASLLIVVLARRLAPFLMDHPVGVQKVHEHPTPRVGGIGIYLGLAVGWLALPSNSVSSLLGLILLAGLPALLFGLAEDMTKRVGVLPRLLATMFSGVLACLLSGVALSRVDMPLIDTVLAYWPVAVVFTAFAVGGVANAINIIDGFHGLASGTSILALLAMTVLAVLAGDMPLAIVALMATTAVAGFWLVNYPWGKLFLGDGGAYFTGFVLAWLAVLLPMRNPDTSAWASLMVCAYPFLEVIYSMLRRSIERRSMGEPDSEHLHSLVASQLVRRHLTGLSSRLQNAAVAPVLWTLVAVMIGIAITFRQHSGWLMAGMLLSALLYHLFYRFLARRRRSGAASPLVAPTQRLNATN